ncbi:MAG: hypothetical protein EPO45_06350 [Sphingobium sp.]|jgi:hypothetical protein|uniref:Uncharacterized protein n=1 Tax=Sphingobium xenophagum TaxID=121428 RepID=A0A249MRT8_SPHXE|nr:MULTISPECIES: hypothetical protein [Sphingobium]MBU0657851.1 hypothetical protein [Alphaproteobacteria bacterium]ODT92841.1 MAG: hypothetical protein ABS86_01395 [Sphingobium sp. SCN 64-10]ASY43837.1 hypothetical protein CJD35_04760 [Sphingobium xenophagum]MBA4756067.1 hypothetical protein [Sphingobium sp.]MBS89743.1 hypothetical protein [Sphingobium sp.]
MLKAVIASSLIVLAMPAVAQDKAPLDKNDPNAVRCKRFQVTGSLVKKERICKTNAEWRAISEQQNRDADDIITRSRAGMNPNG